jgi:hypothetical protein
MVALVKMLGRMFVLGRVATADLSTGQAHTQVDPRIAELHALLTHMCFCLSHFDLIKVGAFFRH